MSAAHLFVIAPCLTGSTAETVAGIAAVVGVTAAGALHVTAYISKLVSKLTKVGQTVSHVLMAV